MTTTYAPIEGLTQPCEQQNYHRFVFIAHLHKHHTEGTPNYHLTLPKSAPVGI